MIYPGLHEFIIRIQVNSGEIIDSPEKSNFTESAPACWTLGMSESFLLHMAKLDEDQSDAAFVATTRINASLYSITDTAPFSNAEFIGITINSGAAYNQRWK